MVSKTDIAWRDGDTLMRVHALSRFEIVEESEVRLLGPDGGIGAPLRNFPKFKRSLNGGGVELEVCIETSEDNMPKFTRWWNGGGGGELELGPDGGTGPLGNIPNFKCR